MNLIERIECGMMTVEDANEVIDLLEDTVTVIKALARAKKCPGVLVYIEAEELLDRLEAMRGE